MKNIILLILVTLTFAFSDESLKIESLFFYRTNDFVFNSKKDTVRVQSSIYLIEGMVVVKNKNQTTKFIVKSQFRNEQNDIISQTIREDNGNPYNFIFSEKTIELVSKKENDGTRIVFVLHD